ncbi:MAG: hypothetical protein ABIE74_03940 [Pseudomonadota bacterium]
MKKILTVGLAVGLMMGLSQVSHAWWVDTNVDAGRYSNSNNDNKRIMENSRMTTTTNNNQDLNSHNMDNRDFSNRSIDNHAISGFNDYSSKDQFTNTFDSHDSSYSSSDTTGSFNNNKFDSSVGQRNASHDVSGTVRNSVMGAFTQKIGADVTGAVSGVQGNLDASTSNNQTFGDVSVGQSDK